MSEVPPLPPQEVYTIVIVHSTASRTPPNKIFISGTYQETREAPLARGCTLTVVGILHYDQNTTNAYTANWTSSLAHRVQSLYTLIATRKRNIGKEQKFTWVLMWCCWRLYCSMWHCSLRSLLLSKLFLSTHYTCHEIKQLPCRTIECNSLCVKQWIQLYEHVYNVHVIMCVIWFMAYCLWVAYKCM